MIQYFLSLLDHKQILLFSFQIEFADFLLPVFDTVRENKIQHMDEKEIFDLAMELDDDDEKKKAKEKEEMKQKKKKSRVEERLASEKRKEEKAAKNSSKKKGNNSNDDDDDNNIATFAKGSGSRSQRKH